MGKFVHNPGSYLMDILSSYFTAVLPPADKRVTEANSLPITDGDVTSSVITHASGKGSTYVTGIVCKRYHLLFYTCLYTAILSYCVSIYVTEVIEALKQQVDARWRHFGTFLHFDPALMNTIDKDNKVLIVC